MASGQSITYLSGAVVPAALNQRPDFGVLFNPHMGNNPAGLGIFALDNGVWTEFKTKGKKPFSLEKFVRLLEKHEAKASQALFAAAPDVVGDWRGTIERSLPMLPVIREYGYPAALVAQNGLEYHLARIPWSSFDVLFLGGGPDPALVTRDNPKGEWKLSSGAARLASLANRKGKAVHMGRVNSGLRLRQARNMGCHSADGTFIAYGPDVNTPEVEGWLDSLNLAN